MAGGRNRASELDSGRESLGVRTFRGGLRVTPASLSPSSRGGCARLLTIGQSLELARRDGDWEKARKKLETISTLAGYDFRLFIGNFFLHQQTWGVIGLWYPKRRAQQSLF